jgi:hypothetical protein
MNLVENQQAPIVHKGTTSVEQSIMTMSRHTNIVEYLLQKGAHPNATAFKSASALFQAVATLLKSID